MLQSGHGRRDRRTDGRKDGQTDGQTDWQTDGVKPIYPPTTSYNKAHTWCLQYHNTTSPQHWVCLTCEERRYLQQTCGVEYAAGCPCASRQDYKPSWLGKNWDDCIRFMVAEETSVSAVNCNDRYVSCMDYFSLNDKGPQSLSLVHKLMPSLTLLVLAMYIWPWSATLF